LAAAALVWLVRRWQGLSVWRISSLAAFGSALALALVLNVYQAYPLARDRMANLQNLESLFTRVVQRAQPDEARAPKTYVFISDASWSSVGMHLLPDVYPVSARFSDLTVTGPQLPSGSDALLADHASLVIIKPWLDQGWQDSLGESLRALGKEACPIQTTSGERRFVLWHAPELAWLCQ
jgi:hypothetical protein